MESEAEAFLIVTQWDTLTKMLNEQVGARCSYLTYGTTVGRLGAAMGTQARRVSVPPEVIWEVLTSLRNVEAPNLPDFRSLMNASYFRMSDHFIDNERYRTFFRPVIDASRAKLQSLHPFLQDILGISITDEYFERYYEEDLPAGFVVRGRRDRREGLYGSGNDTKTDGGERKPANTA